MNFTSKAMENPLAQINYSTKSVRSSIHSMFIKKRFISRVTIAVACLGTREAQSPTQILVPVNFNSHCSSGKKFGIDISLIKKGILKTFFWRRLENEASSRGKVIATYCSNFSNVHRICQQHMNRFRTWRFAAQ